MRFGPGMTRPSAKVLRMHRAKKGPKLFTADEVRRLIAAAGQPLQAMFLLAINAGFGMADGRRRGLRMLLSMALMAEARQEWGRAPTDHVFWHSDRMPFHRRSLPERFNRVKDVAEKTALGVVRDDITIYSFRDLWISEALMAGNDPATVARMAGTSIAMIERVYGHFRNQHRQDAQARVDALRRERAAKAKAPAAEPAGATQAAGPAQGGAG